MVSCHSTVTHQMLMPYQTMSAELSTQQLSGCRAACCVCIHQVYCRCIQEVKRPLPWFHYFKNFTIALVSCVLARCCRLIDSLPP